MNQKVEIKLINIQGQLIASHIFNTGENGINNFELPVQQIKNGLYLINVISGNERFAMKFIKN